MPESWGTGALAVALVLLVSGGACMCRSPMELGLGSQGLTVVTLASMQGCSSGTGLEMTRCSGRLGPRSRVLEQHSLGMVVRVSFLAPEGQPQVSSSMTPVVVCNSGTKPRSGARCGAQSSGSSHTHMVRCCGAPSRRSGRISDWGP